MTTITPDDLKMAALAAGMTCRDDLWGCAHIQIDDRLWRPWSPHTDIGEAARLAVRLNISIHIDGSTAFAHVAGYDEMDDCGYGYGDHDGTEPDKIRAWCEAVTLCAASLRRQMRQIEPPRSDRDEPQRREHLAG